MGKFRGTLKLPCGVPDEIGEYGVQSTQYAVAQCKGVSIYEGLEGNFAVRCYAAGRVAWIGWGVRSGTVRG